MMPFATADEHRTCLCRVSSSSSSCALGAALPSLLLPSQRFHLLPVTHHAVRSCLDIFQIVIIPAVALGLAVIVVLALVVLALVVLALVFLVVNELFIKHHNLVVVFIQVFIQVADSGNVNGLRRGRRRLCCRWHSHSCRRR